MTQNPGDPIVIPRFLRSDKVDYEGELGVVIGRPCKNVTPDEALSYVLGYVAANDVSARDWQKRRVVVSFAVVKALIHFVRWVHAWSLRMNYPIHQVLPFVLL